MPGAPRGPRAHRERRLCEAAGRRGRTRRAADSARALQRDFRGHGQADPQPADRGPAQGVVASVSVQARHPSARARSRLVGRFGPPSAVPQVAPLCGRPRRRDELAELGLVVRAAVAPQRHGSLPARVRRTHRTPARGAPRRRPETVADHLVQYASRVTSSAPGRSGARRPESASLRGRSCPKRNAGAACPRTRTGSALTRVALTRARKNAFAAAGS